MFIERKSLLAHFFQNLQGLVFKGILQGQESKSWVFLRAPEDLEGLRSQKNLIFQNAQIKV